MGGKGREGRCCGNQNKTAIFGFSWNTFDEYRVINVVLSGHFRPQKYDIPVNL